ncbi:MAG: hypothetical protein QXI89_01475 [Candidatus Anstonellales archaeon]
MGKNLVNFGLIVVGRNLIMTNYRHLKKEKFAGVKEEKICLYSLLGLYSLLLGLSKLNGPVKFCLAIIKEQQVRKTIIMGVGKSIKLLW